MPPSSPTPSDALLAVRAACAAIHAAPDQVPRLADLAAAAGLHPRALQRAFRGTVGLTPREYAAACRLSGFKRMLRDGASVTDAIYEAGYGSPSRLYAAAGALAMPPASYGRGGAGARVRYACGQTRVGGLLIAATDQGVCALSLGDDADALAAILRAEFPRAAIHEDAPAMRPWLDLAAQYVAGRAAALEAPLDVLGTAFQRRVWAALRAIPPGETRTYGEIAAIVGRPGAARAVGQACGANPVSLAIPCHRAVAAGSGRGGYRWGLPVKERLLAQEAAPRRP